MAPTRLIDQVAAKVLAGGATDQEEALELMALPEEAVMDLLAAAHRIRLAFKGTSVKICVIINAKSGRCPENCAFCAQSAHHSSGADTYPLVSVEKMVESAREAAGQGAHFFGLVTSGTRLNRPGEWRALIGAVRAIAAEGRIRPCASIGLISGEQAQELKEAGLYSYHHNLETAPSFFSQVCTTHDLTEDMEAVCAAKRAGLVTCCGGILGLGETAAQRVELAFLLRDLGVDSVPLNFLIPIPGTPLEKRPLLGPWEALKSVAVFRFILPDKDIRLCGGRGQTLRQLLPLALLAGANSLMIGNYLTTRGRNPALDFELISDLGLNPSLD